MPDRPCQTRDPDPGPKIELLIPFCPLPTTETIDTMSLADEVHALHAKRYGPDERARTLFYDKLEALSKSQEDATRLVRLCEATPTPMNMVLLGVCHHSGVGVPVDYGRGTEWFRKAAEANDPVGMSCLGRCYLYGIGVLKDDVLAVHWLTKSAHLGNTDAMNHLGDYHQREKADDDDAMKWYAQSASLGDASGMYNLSQCRGVDKDTAIKWLTSSAHHGHSVATYELAGRYDRGDGVVRDPCQAVEWYRKSADLGNTDAMERLGTCYAEGIGVDKDINVALEWFQKTIDNGWNTTTAQASLEKLLLGADFHTTLRYYFHMASFPDDAPRRWEYRWKFRDAIVGDEPFDRFIQRFHSLEDEVKSQKTTIEKLTAENDRLRTEVAYQPDGIGYHEARSDFEGLVGRGLDPGPEN